MRRVGNWRRRRQYLRCNSHAIWNCFFVPADFVVIQEGNRWQLWAMTSQYVRFRSVMAGGVLQCHAECNIPSI